MPGAARDVVATRSALLELEDEERFTREGHEFLDQKRMLLAGELLRRLEQQQALRRRWLDAHAAARQALARAVTRHGLEELWMHPAARFDPGSVREAENFLGVKLARRTSAWAREAVSSEFVNPSPEARLAAERFGALLAASADLALAEANVTRLLDEYRRTERRARALENVILPELRATIALVGEQLEEQAQEEAARLRLRRTYD